MDGSCALGHGLLSVVHLPSRLLLLPLGYYTVVVDREGAKWQPPDDVVFIDAVPKTSVGTFDKLTLREESQNYQLAISRAGGHNDQSCL